MGAHAVVRMVVERDGDAAFVQGADQRARIADQTAVPGVACPAEIACVTVARPRAVTLAFLRPAVRPIVMMPIHIQHHHVEREAVLIVFVRNPQNLLVRVRPPAGIPRAEHIAARKRRRTRNPEKRAQGFFVVRSV